MLIIQVYLKSDKNEALQGKSYLYLLYCVVVYDMNMKKLLLNYERNMSK